jgi:hypothetical protein
MGGILPFTQYSAINQPPVTWDLNKESEMSYNGGVRVSLNLRGYTQFGIACEYQNISQKTTAEGKIGAQSFKFSDLENDVAASFITPYAYFNTGFLVRRGYIYFGVSGGYGLSTMTNFNVVPDLSGNLYVKQEEAKSRGFIFGGQVGYTMGLSRRFALNIEVACRYAALKSDFAKQGLFYSNYEYANGLLYIPTLIGFKYLIGEKD